MNLEKLWYKKLPKSYPKSLKYYEGNIADFLAGSAKKYPDRIVIYFLGRKFTYAEIDDLVNRFATSLHNLGVKKGDVVAIFLANCPQFMITYYAALRIGAIVTFCSPLHSEPEIARHLIDTGAETIITLKLKFFYDKINNIREQTKLKRIIISDFRNYVSTKIKILFTIFRFRLLAKVKKADYIYSFKELLKTPPNPPKVIIDPKKDIAVLALTGGTTGTPKCAIISNYNVVVNVTQLAASMSPALGEKIKPEYIPKTFPSEPLRNVQVVIPWFHTMGNNGYMNLMVFWAMSIVLLPRFDPLDYMKIMRKYLPTIIAGAPQLFIPILNHPKLDKFKKDFAQIKIIGSGAAPLPVEHLKNLRELVNPGGGIIIEGYGLTEVTAGAIIGPGLLTLERKAGSVGFPLIDTDVKIVNDDGEEVEVGQEGEIIIKGPQVMLGYWKDPKATAEIIKDGWLYSGDIGYMDEEGYFFIVDRKKDMLKYKGYQYSSRELEEVLLKYPDIEQAAVVGVKTEMGEIPRAYIVLKENANVKPDDSGAKAIKEFVHSQVALYKKIKELIFRDELPVTMTGKVLKRELRSEIEEES